MSYQEIYQGLLAGIAQMSWVEALAVICAIVSVLCARANHVGVYPAGILGILFSIYIFVGEQYKLYPDAALNLYYLVMSIYGWYFWTRRGSEKNAKVESPTPITWCTPRELLIAALGFLVLWTGLYFWLHTYQINNVPLMDSFSSAMACVGMWLLAKRKIENWIALLIADAVDVGMFFVKKLILFCGLNIFYVIIAILGFLTWKKLYARQKQRAAHAPSRQSL
jgi:nicotinamide mononucleotide transporter